MGKTTPLLLSPGDRRSLERVIQRPNARAGHARRVRVVLMAADGVPGVEIGRRLALSVPQVSRIRRRFVEGGVEGLEDQPRAGRGNTVPKAIVEQVIGMVMSFPPAGHSHWSTREVARRVGLGHTAVHEILRENDLKPHQQRTFKISKDPEFVAKVRDIVGLYLNPPEHALVLCVDEKSQIQALDRTQPGLPLKRGRSQTLTHDYKRNGTATLFAALNAANGEVYGFCQERHRHQEWLKFLRLLDQAMPSHLDLHLIGDNYATHKHPKVQRWLARHPRFHMHFTPTSASWLNMVERFFRDLTQNRLRRGVFRDLEELILAIGSYIDRHNENPKPFIWTARASDILEKVKRARRALHKCHSA